MYRSGNVWMSSSADGKDVLPLVTWMSLTGMQKTRFFSEEYWFTGAAITKDHRMFQTTEMCSLPILEVLKARDPLSSCRQGCFLLEVSRRNQVHSSPLASGGYSPWHFGGPLIFTCIIPHVSLSPHFPLLNEDTSHIRFRVYSNLV